MSVIDKHCTTMRGTLLLRSSLVGLLLVASQPRARAQCVPDAEKSLTPSVGTAPDYREMLDRLLPTVSSVSKTQRFILVLRFMPVMKQEAQVEIAYDVRSVGHVTMRTLSHSLNAQLQRESDNIASPQRSLSAVKQICRSHDVESSAVLAWLSSYWQALAEASKVLAREAASVRGELVPVVLDPSQYEIGYYDEQQSLRWSISGTDFPEGSTTSPLLKWMNRVRKDVDSVVARSSE